MAILVSRYLALYQPVHFGEIFVGIQPCQPKNAAQERMQ